MKHIAFKLLVLASGLALPAFGERQETITLYDGTPGAVSWQLDKSQASAQTFGTVTFTGIQNTAGGASAWKIPAFDTQGGTRTPTGFSATITGGFQATLNGDSANSGPNPGRHIEGYYREASFRADVGIDPTEDTTYDDDYELNSFGWEEKTIPAAEQTDTTVWDLDCQVHETGPVLRAAANARADGAFARAVGGQSTLVLSANISWLPYYQFSREWFGTGIQNFNIDCGTNQWAIPGETGNDGGTGTAYPVDKLGRRNDSFTGLSGYPPGWQPENDRAGTYQRTGAANPLKVEITFYYTQQGDCDDGQSAYAAAGSYAGTFEYTDNKFYYYNNPTDEFRHTIPGNLKMERAEFHLAAIESTLVSGGIELYDYETDDKADAMYGRSIDRNFYWMDANRDRTVDPLEYRAWRKYVDLAKAIYSDPTKHLATKDWAEMASPAELVTELGKLPSKEETLVFKILDTNKDKRLTRSEWLAIYPVKPQTESGFALIDINADGGITAEELANIPSTAPAVLLKAIIRIKLFAKLDLDHNLRVSLDEITRMWVPGTAAKTIASYWKRMGRKTTEKGMSAAEWVKAPVIPSITGWKTASRLRAIRRETFFKIDKDRNKKLSQKEFNKLFTAGTAKKKIAVAWKTATEPAKGQSRPKEISYKLFQDCRLTGATIR